MPCPAQRRHSPRHAACCGIVMLLALVAPAVAPPAAVWRIDGPPGRVRSITAMVGSGGCIVADGFIDDADAARAEAAALRSGTAPPGSCARASAARPFTRLRRFAANGRLLWTWDVARDATAIRLMGAPGDCLSPDGGRLMVIGFMTGPGAPPKEVQAEILAVDRPPRFVAATGRQTGLPFGRLRQLDTAYWRRGGDATLAFTLYDGDTGQKTSDLAVLGRRP